MKKIYITVLLLVMSLGINAQDINSQIKQNAQNSYEYFNNIYKTFHQNPELGRCEVETSKRMAEEMEKMGFKVTRNIGGYGVVGIFENGKGKTIMLRADMDALPIKEATGLEYASTKTMDVNGVQTPVFHACGHDMHSTVMLGTLANLVKMKKHWKGTIMAVAQPAEEGCIGAKAMLKDGLFEKFNHPDYALAYHVSPDVSMGTVAYTKGENLAGGRNFKITFRGKGAHGAYPHKGIDPIILTANAIIQFQTIIPRNIEAGNAAIITVGSIHGGIRPNIIPNEVELLITSRFFKEEIGDFIEKRIREISNGCAIAAGLPEDLMPKIEVLYSVPPVYNNIALSEKVAESMQNVLGDGKVNPIRYNMVSEDFAFYSNYLPNMPSCLFWLGVNDPQNPTTALHSPTFTPKFKEGFETGVTAMTKAIIDLTK